VLTGPIMVRKLLCLTFIALLTTAAHGAPPPRVTYFGDSLLSRCDLVVYGVVASRSVLPNGVAVTTVRIEETLLGTAPGKRLLLSSPDPAYHGAVDRRVVLFLSRPKAGGAYTTIDLFAVEDAAGLSRLRMARAYIECEAITGLLSRVKSARSLHMSNLTGGDVWARNNAIRELAWFTGHWARTFTRAERTRMEAVRVSMPASSLREMLSKSMHRIDAVLPRKPAKAKPEVAPDREALFRRALADVSGALSAIDRAGRLAALVRARPARARRDLMAFLDDGSPEVRRVAAFQLGEVEYAAAAEALMAVLRRPKEDAAVRRNAARALGIIRHTPAVPLLVQLLEAGGDGRAETAVLALARIAPTSSDAIAALIAYGKKVTGNGPRDQTLRKLLKFVATPAFAKQEEILRKLRRSRLAADR
jgi:HEAT repeats